MSRYTTTGGVPPPSHAEGKFDDIFLSMASQHKGIEDLLSTIFDIFQRRTDLFHVMERPSDRMGFPPGIAQKMVMGAFTKSEEEYKRRTHGQKGKEDGSSPAPQKIVEESAQKESIPAQQENIGRGGGSSSSSSSSSNSSSSDSVGGGGKTHISTWNGGVTKHYIWSQSLSDLTVEIDVGKQCRAKDLQIDITATKLNIKFMNDGEHVLHGDFHEKVAIDECLWSLEDGHKIIMTLEKQRHTWWKCVLEGDEEIDTSKVESTKRVEEYDGETQGAIRKILFDQNQKAQGKPTSDQLKNEKIMKDAWNQEGSPFKGRPFDPTLLNFAPGTQAPNAK